jgi:hypothetical protein
MSSFVGLAVTRDVDHSHQGLANGFPLSGVVSRKELTDKLKPGTMVCLQPRHLTAILRMQHRAGHMPETRFHVLQPLQLRMHSKRRRFSTT